MIEIARDIEKPPATVYSYLRYHGGVQPRARVQRANSLSADERETISRGLASGCSIRTIAKELVRSPSTVCPEDARDGGRVRHRACMAEKAFLKRSKRPKSLLLADNPSLKRLVIDKLASDWSPQQITGWLKHYGPGGKDMYVSHETIYKSLFIQARGALREVLKKHLRTKRMFRHARSHRAARGCHSSLNLT